MASCGSCGGCTGDCGGCTGCARELTLTEKEISFLRYMAHIPFLPVARALGEDTPVYEDGGDSDENAMLLRCLEKKGLISLDYDLPLKNYAERWYVSRPVRGSMALTGRGQQVLELLEYQGSQEES